jgi:hypothetical protein
LPDPPRNEDGIDLAAGSRAQQLRQSHGLVFGLTATMQASSIMLMVAGPPAGIGVGDTACSQKRMVTHAQSPRGGASSSPSGSMAWPSSTTMRPPPPALAGSTRTPKPGTTP